MEKKSNQKISAIVCAYNEEGTIRNVIQPLVDSSLIDEVILVDDGSEDQTAVVMGSYQALEKVQVIALPANRGKGHAMASAASKAKGDILFFIDADLINLNSNHIDMLAGPVLNQEADMMLGTPVSKERVTLPKRLDPFKPLSGQRVLYREDFLPIAERIRSSGYGVETIINLHYREQRKTVKSIFLPNLHHPIKIQKSGCKNSLTDYLQEGREILKTLFQHPDLVFGAIFGSALQ